MSETARAFDLISTLRARPKYKKSYFSLVVEDYTQQNRDWAAVENLRIDTFEKPTMTTYKSKYKSNLFRPRVTQKYIHVKPLYWHFETSFKTTSLYVITA